MEAKLSIIQEDEEERESQIEETTLSLCSSVESMIVNCTDEVKVGSPEDEELARLILCKELEYLPLRFKKHKEHRRFSGLLKVIERSARFLRISQPAIAEAEVKEDKAGPNQISDTVRIEEDGFSEKEEPDEHVNGILKAQYLEFLLSKGFHKEASQLEELLAADPTFMPMKSIMKTYRPCSCSLQLMKTLRWRDDIGGMSIATINVYFIEEGLTMIPLQQEDTTEKIKVSFRQKAYQALVAKKLVEIKAAEAAEAAEADMTSSAPVQGTVERTQVPLQIHSKVYITIPAMKEHKVKKMRGCFHI